MAYINRWNGDLIRIYKRVNVFGIGNKIYLIRLSALWLVHSSVFCKISRKSVALYSLLNPHLRNVSVPSILKVRIIITTMVRIAEEVRGGRG